MELASDTILRPILHPHTFIKISIGYKSFKTDGAVVDMSSINPNSARWMSALREVKHELCTGTKGKPDACYQATAYYAHFYGSRTSSPLFQHTPCPTVLLEILGPHIRVSALSWMGEKVSVVPMTTHVHTLILQHDIQHAYHLARLLGALRRCITELSDWYVLQLSTLQPVGGLAPTQAALMGPAILRSPQLEQGGMPYPMLDYDDAAYMVPERGTKVRGVDLCSSIQQPGSPAKQAVGRPRRGGLKSVACCLQSSLYWGQSEGSLCEEGEDSIFTLEPCSCPGRPAPPVGHCMNLPSCCTLYPSWTPLRCWCSGPKNAPHPGGLS